jgi:hypothetical protein
MLILRDRLTTRGALRCRYSNTSAGSAGITLTRSKSTRRLRSRNARNAARRRNANLQRLPFNSKAPDGTSPIMAAKRDLRIRKKARVMVLPRNRRKNPPSQRHRPRRVRRPRQAPIKVPKSASTKVPAGVLRREVRRRRSNREIPRSEVMSIANFRGRATTISVPADNGENLRRNFRFAGRIRR